jgi:hypothetical protein
MPARRVVKNSQELYRFFTEAGGFHQNKTFRKL